VEKNSIEMALGGTNFSWAETPKMTKDLSGWRRSVEAFCAQWHEKDTYVQVCAQLQNVQVFVACEKWLG